MPSRRSNSRWNEDYGSPEGLGLAITGSTRQHPGMSRRIQPRPYRVGTGENGEPEAIEELLNRREKHERLTRGAPSRAFGEVLKNRRAALRGESKEPDEEEAAETGARDPLLGLVPGQNSTLVNRPSGRRSGQVILKG